MVKRIVRPKTIREALRARAAAGSAYLGGGTWLNSQRALGHSTFISLELLRLQDIEVVGPSCRIGACATVQQLIDFPGTPEAIRKAAGLTASRTLRNMATVGGELALCPTDSALIPVFLALEAKVHVAGKKEPVAVADMQGGAEGRLITGITVGARPRSCGLRTVSLTSHSSRSLVVVVRGNPQHGSLGQLCIIVSDCVNPPVRLRAIEKAIQGKPLPPKSEIEEMVRAQVSPAADLHASSQYKQYLAGVHVSDLLHELARVDP